jgi:redox-sensing transcriptional repressor
VVVPGCDLVIRSGLDAAQGTGYNAREGFTIRARRADDLEKGAQRRAGVNTVNSSPKVPIPTLERLATYLRYLIDLEASDVETISSTDVEKQTGINAAQFRKDLSYFGEFGKPGVGYNVVELQARIARILKIDRLQPIIVIGAGNLGSALIGYPGLHEHKFHIVAAFDSDPAKIGRMQGELIVQDENRLHEVNRTLGARIAILAVPAAAAQMVAEEAIAAGVRAILNFAPLILRVPERVVVRNVSFLQELAVLSYHLSTDSGK